MTGPDDIDWSGIRAASVSVGVREAARQAARNLSSDEQERFVFRVLKRSQREGWVTAIAEAKASVIVQNAMPMSSVVLKGSEALAHTLLEDGNATKLAGMKYARRTTEYAARLAEESPEKALAEANNVKASLQSAALAGSWRDGSEGGGTVINIALLGQPPESQ